MTCVQAHRAERRPPTIPCWQNLPAGMGSLSVITNDDGGIIDDCIVTNAGDHLYMVINAGHEDKDLPHMASHLDAFVRSGKDASMETLAKNGLVAVQGPKAAEVCHRGLPPPSPPPPSPLLPPPSPALPPPPPGAAATHADAARPVQVHVGGDDDGQRHRVLRDAQRVHGRGRLRDRRAPRRGRAARQRVDCALPSARGLSGAEAARTPPPPSRP